jgi:arginyl-tRNA synthetase
MSSRTGKVILGEQLLDDAKKVIKKQFSSDEGVAEQIAVGAVKYSFLKVGREQEIAFDLKDSVSLEGNSGPYIQYTYARTQSVLSKNHKSKIKSQNESFNNIQLNQEELNLLRTFIRYSEIITTSAENYAPNLLCNYLYELAHKFNTFYQKHTILEKRTKDKELSQFRLALTSATGQILKNGLNLLGIKAPEKM